MKRKKISIKEIRNKIDINNFKKIAEKYNTKLSIINENDDCLAFYLVNSNKICLNPIMYREDMKYSSLLCKLKIEDVWTLIFFHELGHCVSISELPYCREIVRKLINKEVISIDEKLMLEKYAWRYAFKLVKKEYGMKVKTIKENINYVKDCINNYKQMLMEITE